MRSLPCAETTLAKQILVSLSDISYLVHPEVLGHVQPGLPEDSLRPATLVSLDSGEPLEASAVTELLGDFSRQDDVYSDNFAQTLIVQTSESVNPSSRFVGLPQVTWKDELGPFEAVFTVQLSSSQDLLPVGPYFLVGSNIHQAWRLYPDKLTAFITTVVPNSVSKPQSFVPLNATVGDGISKAVAVPSRLYDVPCPSRPLAGMRISIKDNMDLAGIKTTLMNRAYAELYGPARLSAAVVDNLLSLGAVVVGKTKLAAFASAQEPTGQWVDYHCPFNPRADGYQHPGGSSTGAAAAVAGYPWLDFSIGTDTTGSIRVPAAACGLFALRSTYGSSPWEGIARRCRAFDTIGLTSRDLNSMGLVARHLLDVTKLQKFPKRILYPSNFLPVANSEQQAMIDAFTAILEDYLAVQSEKIDIKELWKANTPEAADGKSLEEFLSKSAFWPMYYDLYNELAEFREQYETKYQKEVYVGPYVRWSWDMAKNVTEAEKAQGLSELAVFQTWFAKHVLGPDDDTGSNAILIMPSGRTKPKYRDEPNELPGVIEAFTEYYLATILELPQVIVPVGQLPYDSRVSGRQEYRPIVGSIVAAKGCDLLLIELAKSALRKAGWPTAVGTGRMAFPLGGGVRYCQDSVELPKKTA